MLKKYIKKFLKRKPVLDVFAFLIYWYLRLVYKTSKWEFIWPTNYAKTDFDQESKTIFALWHNKMLFGPGIFVNHKHNTVPLISPHSDGKIGIGILKKFGYEAILGSTNKDSYSALRNIIKELNTNHNIFIVPDGPRGPIYEINSNITNIAKKYAKKLIPISCAPSKYFILKKSWDKTVVPMLFGTIVVLIGKPLDLSNTEEENNKNLKKCLTDLSTKANTYCTKIKS